MTDTTREQILSRLRNAPPGVLPPPRPKLSPMTEASTTAEQRVETFRQLLEAQTGVLKRARGDEGVRTALAEVFEEEKITRAIASTDDCIAGLDLPAWGAGRGFTITTRQDYPDRTAFKQGVFAEVEAGITGADFGFVESGTLCLAARRDMPRLISLAPLVHIAVLPIERLVPSYESMTEKFFANAPPSQLILITGPSMTADIQATPFKGMHGPRRLIVILKESA
jgi:L-lactate dehydrogenase complex protein LldG